MAGGQTGVTMRDMSVLFRSGATGSLTDGQLLEQFVTGRGETVEAAFATLVDRHGPMVLGVCRRALSDPHDAEDAFQATFLVLVRKAGSVCVEDSLGRWLYGVSRRVASRARTSARRRLSRERELAKAGDQPAKGEPSEDRLDLTGVLDEELCRLPGKYRDPLVLCYLQGQTHEGAARQLGWPVGTVRGRLARARDLLRTRLVRRGFAPSTALAGATVSAEAWGAIPPLLRDTTVRAASQIAAGKEAASVVSAQVIAWAERGMTSMSIAGGKAIAGALVIASAIGVAVGLAASRAQAERPLPKAQASSEPRAAAALQKDQEQFLGTWETSGTNTEFINGVMQPPKPVKLKWVFTAETLASTDSDGFLSQEARYTIDPTATPKTIDLTFRDTGATWRGIYRFDGEELVVSYAVARPKDFREEAGNLVHRFRRVSRRPVPLAAKYELAPGCLWVISPSGGMGYSSMASNGIHFFVDTERDGALAVTLAHVEKLGPEPGPRYHPVAFDASGKRHLLKVLEGGSSTGAATPGMSISQVRYRLDPKDLPADKVKNLGIEAVPADVVRAQKEDASAKALAQAKAEGILVLPRPRVGAPFAFTLKTTDGRIIDTRDLKGKVVLVDCWATWCTPCMAKMPRLKALYEARHPGGLEIVGVNFDNDLEVARKTLKTLALPWPEVFVPTDEHTRELWGTGTGIESLPRLLLIDRQGVLRYDGGPDGIDEQVAKWLDGPGSDPRR